ncbi:precorrin-6y C5,15-methyltransferase (decarboxylating) subunit CbiE [uncultured Tateyamaria sp.]|uniref:precorrin-6y C5,15-methyltransferase (decarboxylating) subunit CbiE n=1 Tax=uncultured Tateyamaria sp. TaxID=455651 RepID=UPI002614CA21|nr:precorrin-6y C5,15-methyltransferase (decarboxylating) subunit CbiE [uncultured Tateyamaria sp.]
MSDAPWLTIIGIGEDGVAGLSGASQAALARAEVVMGPPRHLDLIPDGAARRIAWPVPFADGLAMLDGLSGQCVVVLASGDPFWFGAGSVIARRYAASEWVAHPGPSCFALAAAQLGWALENTTCLGLHAAPIARMRRHLAQKDHLIVTLRDGEAVAELTGYLSDTGFGDSTVTVFEHLGGPAERVTSGQAATLKGSFGHPVCAAIEIAGNGASLTIATGQSDDTFASDGQMTKRPIRAITLSTLAPKPHEHLWDIGGGSGSIALEWLLSHPTTHATCIEPRSDRAARIRQNSVDLGVDGRLTVIKGVAPDALGDLDTPDALFIGGGLSQPTLDAAIAQGVRLVVNAVTLEGEVLLTAAHATHGGDLLRIALSNATPLGSKRGWTSAYPVVQWSRVP